MYSVCSQTDISFLKNGKFPDKMLRFFEFILLDEQNTLVVIQTRIAHCPKTRIVHCPKTRIAHCRISGIARRSIANQKYAMHLSCIWILDEQRTK